jgi:hypothetical protein
MGAQSYVVGIEADFLLQLIPIEEKSKVFPVVIFP